MHINEITRISVGADLSASPHILMSILRIHCALSALTEWPDEKANTPNGNVLFKDTFLKGTPAYLFLFQTFSTDHDPLPIPNSIHSPRRGGGGVVDGWGRLRRPPLIKTRTKHPWGRLCHPPHSMASFIVRSYHLCIFTHTLV